MNIVIIIIIIIIIIIPPLLRLLKYVSESRTFTCSEVFLFCCTGTFYLSKANVYGFITGSTTV